MARAVLTINAGSSSAVDPVVEQVEPVGRLRLRLEIQLPLYRPDFIGCCQAHRQSPILNSFESTPEVRVLPSAGVTQPQQYYDPVRHPPERPFCNDVEAATPRPRRASPNYPAHPSDMPCPLPRWIRTGACVGASRSTRSLPRYSGGSASITSLSRPAHALLTLRPAGLLNRPRRPLSRGFDRADCPTKPLVSYQGLPTTPWMDPSSTG
jgi:hypothetical protein